jgi:hypothetical protein
LNRQPADYKSAALPIELRQQAILTPTRFCVSLNRNNLVHLGAELRAEHINITIPSSESTGNADFLIEKGGYTLERGTPPQLEEQNRHTTRSRTFLTSPGSSNQPSQPQ